MKQSTLIYILFVIVSALHLLVFITYSFDPNPTKNFLTVSGEIMKTAIPFILLATIIPAVRRVTNTLLPRTVVNTVSLGVMVVCVVCQVLDVPGQAWSTVAFSVVLILSMYNYLLDTNSRLDRTTAITFSFMMAWAGWVVFETVFQIGLWYYHPRVYLGNWVVLIMSMRNMLLWLVAPVTYIAYVMWTHRASMRFTRLFGVLMFLSIIATVTWFSRGMLIPLPADEEGRTYRLAIEYMSADHLDFSISRVSQVCLMGSIMSLFVHDGYPFRFFKWRLKAPEKPVREEAKDV